MTDLSQRQAQIDEVYKALGRFVAEFSGLVLFMEMAIQFAIGRQQTAVQALLSELTIYPLSKSWRSVMIEVFKPDKADDAILGQLVSEVQDLTEIRNDIAHGVWLVGYGNEETTDWSEASLMRPKNTSIGISYEKSALASGATAKAIEQLATRASVAAEAIKVFDGLMMHRTGMNVSTKPSERIRISGRGNKRIIEVTTNGVDWRTSAAN